MHSLTHLCLLGLRCCRSHCISIHLLHCLRQWGPLFFFAWAENAQKCLTDYLSLGSSTTLPLLLHLKHPASTHSPILAAAKHPRESDLQLQRHPWRRVRNQFTQLSGLLCYPQSPSSQASSQNSLLSIKLGAKLQIFISLGSEGR